MLRKFLPIVLLTMIFTSIVLGNSSTYPSSQREKISMDKEWRFAFGHPCDTEKDYKHATAYFSQFAKAGWDIAGPSSPKFDDSFWRPLDVPHDWAVELPFDPRGGHSHGYKAIGHNFPENSVGWYRKHFTIPQSDIGKKIKIKFDGIFRHSEVWVNGFYCGLEPSSYNEIVYDITDYLNYNGDNVVVVRVDATMEEGWYYEGAGIYRHVWLVKSAPLHIENNGIFVTTEVNKNAAEVSVQSTIINESLKHDKFTIQHFITDPEGVQVSKSKIKSLELKNCESLENSLNLKVKNPKLWSLDEPNLYSLSTTISKDGQVIDVVNTTFGIRTIDFDPNEGFFLNSEHVKIKGTNNHQEHAGVGTAMPDAVRDFRIQRLKDMGSNAFRTSHNPPAPELLEACDRLGMLVMNENRLMGSTEYTLRNVEKMMMRDRNHPCLIAWSLGNEEWAIEGNIKGERIATTMQEFAKKFDTTRPFTIASSGGWGQGNSVPIELMGFNYIAHGNTDEYHKQFPNKPSVGTEESTTQGTRGIYSNDVYGHEIPTDRTEDGHNIETGWKYYAERPYLAGLFFWTGFDYRGESNPFDYPAIHSHFGIMDDCGFAKDPFYYLKSWWQDEPVLYIAPHWNWTGKEGENINVWVHSNCEEVELFLNDKSLGRKPMEKNSHLEWDVKYTPGTLRAEGFIAGKKIIISQNETTGEAAKIQLIPNKNQILADGQDASVITIKITDDNDRFMPTADNKIAFTIDGPGKIIGVGNGDPICHEADKVFEAYNYSRIGDLKVKEVDEVSKEILPNFNDSAWPAHFYGRNQENFAPEANIVIRGNFVLTESIDNLKITLFGKSMCIDQSLYINGHLVAENVVREAEGQVYLLDNSILNPGKNVYAVKGKPLTKRTRWEELNTDPGIIQIITPEPQWRRSAFNGLAQVIVQSTGMAGKITLTAESDGLSAAKIEILSK